LETAREELKDLEEEKSAKEDKLEELEEAFDEEEYESVVEEASGLREEIPGLEATRTEKESRLEELTEELEELREKAEKLEERESEAERLEADIGFVQFLRDTVEDAGGQMAEVLIKEISDRADSLFRQLRGRPSEELEWRKDYQVVVTENGEDKEFEELSGGEKMGAALAIRLAILNVLSDVDVVFLDEPTTNLDGEKRGNLVDQIQNLPGFEQLTVVSHDDTFESLTENAITLEKKDGATRVVNQ
jgi:exonuclease SbcC